MFKRTLLRKVEHYTPTVEVRYVGEDLRIPQARYGQSLVEVKYANEDCTIQEINLIKRDSSRDRNRHDIFIQCAQTPEGKELANRIVAATDEVKIWKGQPCEEKAIRKNGWYALFTVYAKADDLRQIVNILHGILDKEIPIIDEHTRNQLLADIDIKVYSEDIHADILEKADIDVKNAKDLALQYDREYSYDGVLWALAEYLREKDLLDDAAEMYAAIPRHNRSYEKSCEQLRLIYQEQLTANDIGIIQLTSEEKQSIREKLLELSLLSGNHDYSTNLFYDLAGWGLSPDQVEIKLNSNPEAVIKLSRQIAKLNQDKKRLQDELAQLKKNAQSDSVSVYASSSSMLYRQPSFSDGVTEGDDAAMTQEIFNVTPAKAH